MVETLDPGKTGPSASDRRDIGAGGLPEATSTCLKVAFAFQKVISMPKISTPDDIDPILPVTLNGFRVLLVEDSWIVAASLKSLLQMIGVDIVGPCHSLAEATAAAASGAFDVAVMDLDLNGQMSSDLIAALHQRGVPVVVVTGQTAPSIDAGKAVAVMTKPIRAESLLRTLRRIRADMPAPPSTRAGTD
jgi:CheY-like chemotaxis protein